MISASLTSTRHIAASHAAWIAAGAVGTVEQYVQAAIERVADSWVESTRVDQISVGEFVLRFTGAEFAAITGSADPNVEAILATLRAHESVRLGSADAVNGIAYLVGVGLLTQERGAEVLHYDIPQVVT